MAWDLEPRDRSVVLHMRSGRANRMNPAFFSDCHAAFDQLDAEYPGWPMVLTGEGNTFSAGLDFHHVFPLFRGGDTGAIDGFFEGFKAMMNRVFLAPRRTVAALNGHAFAGGFILAVACDARVGARGEFHYALNEIPIGIAIPSSYLEIVRHALGDRVTAEAALEGRTYDVDGAVTAGILGKAVAPEALLAEAVALAEVTPLDAAPAYAATKQALRAPVVERFAGACRELDPVAFKAITEPASGRLQQAAMDRLKSRAKG